MTIDIKEEIKGDMEWKLFNEAWQVIGNRGGFTAYSVEDLVTPEIIEQEIQGVHVSFRYCLTFRGVRIYRGVYLKTWMYLHESRGIGEPFYTINSCLQYKVDRILQELDVTL